MAIFVTIIVALYWWDWESYIEDHFIGSPKEFAVDFSMLVTLVFLFVHHDDPLGLAFNFLFLGVLDLVWVGVHIAEHPGQTLRLRKRWIAQKLMGIGIYLVGLLAVTYLLDLFPPYVAGLTIIFYASLVRKLCFGELRSRSTVEFSPAKTSDWEAVLQINSHYVTSNHGSEFLLHDLAGFEFDGNADSNQGRFYVARIASNIVAFAWVKDSLNPELLEEIRWFSPTEKKRFLEGRPLYIEQVAVDPAYTGRGIGRSFYDWLIKMHTGTMPCAFVAVEPRCNSGSLAFHSSMGFDRAGEFNSAEFHGIANYRSLFVCIHR